MSQHMQVTLKADNVNSHTAACRTCSMPDSTCYTLSSLNCKLGAQCSYDSITTKHTCTVYVVCAVALHLSRTGEGSPDCPRCVPCWAASKHSVSSPRAQCAVHRCTGSIPQCDITERHVKDMSHRAFVSSTKLCDWLASAATHIRTDDTTSKTSIQRLTHSCCSC